MIKQLKYWDLLKNNIDVYCFEQWKDIIGYEGLYQISSFGRIKSLEKYIKTSTEKGFKLTKENILKKATRINLHKNNKSTRFNIKKLVLQHFIGLNCDNIKITHRDKNIYNNKLSNLKYDFIIDKDNEIWAKIKNFEEYEISNYGRIKHNNKLIITADGKSEYQRVTLFKNKKKKRFFVHRLVLITFNRSPRKNEICCHNDGNPKNNHISNLRWGSQSDNHLDKNKHGTMYCGEKHHRCIINEIIVKKIREEYSFRGKNGGKSAVSLSKELGISRGIVYQVIKNRTWKHV